VLLCLAFVVRSQGAEQPALLELQQQLNSNPLFRQLVDQPDKLLSVLQHDQVLADAAAGSPEIAALLDPSTLKQVLSVLQGGPLDPQQQQQAGTVPVVHRKALMQLQNYAMQLQQARMAGVNTAQLQQPVQLQPATADATSVSIQGSNAGASVMAGSEMWAAMQQRFTKLQQRGSMLGAMPGLQGKKEARACICWLCSVRIHPLGWCMEPAACISIKCARNTVFVLSLAWSCTAAAAAAVIAKAALLTVRAFRSLGGQRALPMLPPIAPLFAVLLAVLIGVLLAALQVAPVQQTCSCSSSSRLARANPCRCHGCQHRCSSSST
jgi:hypothetical protein